MGRMLETLRNQDAGRAAATADCVVDWSLAEPADVPFIEVGGPTKVEGSPQVLAAKHPPQSKLSAPHRPAETIAPAPAPAARVVHLAEARPMSVSFEVWPGTKRLARTVAAEVLTYHQPEHAISQQYLTLLDQMTQPLPEGSGVLLLSGIRGLVGTTTVLLNLAVACARHRKKCVAVWEANLGRTGLVERLGLAASLGVADVIAGGAALEKVALEGPIPGLVVLPAHGQSHRPATTLCTPEAARWLVSWLRDRYDLVFIDGPNLENTLALGALAPLADDLYLVAPQGEKHLVHPGLTHTISRMGGRLRGLIHTQFEADPPAGSSSCPNGPP